MQWMTCVALSLPPSNVDIFFSEIYGTLHWAERLDKPLLCWNVH